MSVPVEQLFPENLPDLITHNLVPASDLMQYPGETQKFYISGHPDLVIRQAPSAAPEDSEPLESTWDSLRAAGTNLLPAKNVILGDTLYTATFRVTGQNLEEALVEHKTGQLIKETDVVFASLYKHLLKCRRLKEPSISDVYTANQFMVGAIAPDPISRVRLVDLTDREVSPWQLEDFADQILNAAGGLGELELLTERPMPLARRFLKKVIENLEAVPEAELKWYASRRHPRHTRNQKAEIEYLKKIPNAARYSVAHHISLDIEDTTIMRLPEAPEL